MQETRKLNSYRLSRGYARYFNGDGIDIGCGNDMLDKDAFGSTSIRPYDRADGDAQTCLNIPNSFFDFVYSSHCLEHMDYPSEALRHWLRICKPGGYVVFAVPHEIYYEKNKWPSKFNSDHKWSFRLEQASDLPKSISISELVTPMDADLVLAELLLNFDMTKFHEDQTLGDGVCQIDVVLRKRRE